MTKKKYNNNALYAFIINLLYCFVFLNSEHYTKANENIINEKSFNYKKKYKIHNHQNYFKFFQKNKNQYLTQMNKTVYTLTPNYFTSKIQIDKNSLKLMNIYSQDDEQLIFNQLGLHITNEKTIYNFGVGYRKYFYNQWYIGNNFFYDSILSKNNKKILSIGSEFFKKSIYIATNTYHNISNNHFIYTNHKKYIPYAYDIRTKYPLPIFSKTFGTMNIEYYFNNKNHSNNIIFQNIYNIINKTNYHTPSKLTLGIIYTPISILSFNINKTIISSTKNYETKINIIANYKINIPWTYYTRHIINNYHKNIFLSDTKYSIINRNNTTILNHNIDIYKTIKIINIHETIDQKIPLLETNINKNTTSQDTNEYNNQLIQQKENIILKLKNTYYIFPLPCSDMYINVNKISTPLYQTIQHQILNKKKPTIDIINQNINLQTLSKNSTYHENSINPISKDNSYNIFNETNNDTSLQQDTKYDDTTISKNNIHHLDTYLSEKKSEIYPKTTSIIQPENTFNKSDNYNIPTPPPISEFLKKENYYKTAKYDITNENTDISKYTNSQNQIEKINKHKQKNFSSLGSQEHILKLNNIIKKREKTISSSSNDSNNSEPITLLKIIERQSALTIHDDDTDSDDKNSINSNHEFSE